MKIKKSLKIVFFFTLINLTEALEWQNELVSVILPNGNSCLCSSYATATSGIIEALTLACKQVSLLAQQVDVYEHSVWVNVYVLALSLCALVQN